MDWHTLLGIFLLVFAGGLLWDWRRSRAKRATETDQSRSQKLYRHADSIEQFVEKSAHPRELLDQPDFKGAAAILSRDDVSFETLRQYATGASWPLACVALFVLTKKGAAESLASPLLAQLSQMRPWTIHFALQYLVSLKERPPLGAPCVPAQMWWRDNPFIVGAFKDYFVRRAELGDEVSFGNSLSEAERSETNAIEWLLYRCDHPSASELRVQLKAFVEARVDRAFLNTVGRFWTINPEDELLIEPESWRSRIAEAAAAVLKASPRRSVLVSGESRVGKTAFLKLVARALEVEGWTIFETSAAQLQAGQTYIGQLEERVRKLVAEIDAKKRLAWYVPDFLQIATSGTHQGQSATILDQVSQAMTAGKLVILSEATPAGVVRLFQMRPSLRSALEQPRLQPMGEADTQTLVRELGSRMADATGLEIEPQSIETVLHLSHQYLGETERPGATIDLLKRAANLALGAGRKTLGAEDVLETLSQLSGLPRSVLDDNQRLDLAAARDYFARRVIGQDEAVDAVVDRIAMLKAGLVDPHRPIGVFLFAGPTGTGKTELAKTLADYLFGSPDRMARLDMSELQTAESTAKILGSGAFDTDSLAERVRKQPFSVVLLDEFEKAHRNAWDLFLQVFDDGRLTDANGRVVDFRHTIIVLTTNLGATAHASAAIGFARQQGLYSEDQILQAVGQTFRPEFVNRLDKIIVFRPLTRAFMRQILEKELALVLERRGLRQRDWAVEWEDSAINFLLDKGFTTNMGARPLRRAIDDQLLAPLAATMVEHRYPAGDQFLFVRSDGRAIQVEFVDPDADGEPAMPAVAGAGSDVSLARAILRASGSNEEHAALAEAMAKIDGRLDSHEWQALKEKLAAEVNDPAIWHKDDRGSIFARFELIDRVAEARRTASRLRLRLDARQSGKRAASRELIARLALQLYLVDLGIEDALEGAPIDALLAVERVAAGSDASEGAARRWCERLTEMYRGWCLRRHMRLREVASPERQFPILEIAGFGAFRTLKGEAGLHVFEEGDGTRALARVRLAPAPDIDPDSRDADRLILRALAGADDGAAIVRRYREEPDRLVRDARRGWRSGKLEAVLAGDFDLIGLMKEDEG